MSLSRSLSGRPGGSPHPYRRIIPVLMAMWWMLEPHPAWADDDLATRVKAAYLYNFLLFVHWPGVEPIGPIRLCTLGRGPLNRALAPVERRRIRGRPIELVPLDDLQDAGDCPLLFINQSEEPYLHQAIAVLGDAPILTVSDIHRFARRGGMIGFVHQDRRIRLEIDLDKVRAAGLSVSSKLLEVAARVYRSEEPRP